MEQETSIVWDEEEKVARIYTASPVSTRKLDRLCAAYPREYQKVWEEKDADGRVTAARYQTGCKRVRFVKPASEARIEQGRRIAQMAAERRREKEPVLSQEDKERLAAFGEAENAWRM
jgi:hypothetical protein